MKDLKNYLDDIELAYDNYLPIPREKFLDLQKILEFISKSTNSKFYESLYCAEKAPISKSQQLLYNLFDEKNKNKKSNESKRRKTGDTSVYVQQAFEIISVANKSTRRADSNYICHCSRK